MKKGIKCKECGDELFSYHRHDFKWCSCKSVAIDGGDDYMKVVGDPNKVEDIEKDKSDNKK